MSELALLPALTAQELDELGVAITSRLIDLDAATDPEGALRERIAICQSLATAIAEARMSLR